MFRGLFERSKKKGENQGAYSQFSKDYSMSDVILGVGAYAEVRKGYRKKTHEVVAVKIIDKAGLSQKELSGLTKEVKILKKLNHKNVVRLYDYFEDEENMYVVMEYVGGGELFKKIVSEDRPFTENDARRIIRTLGEALKHCKDNGVIHRDIKPQNLLLTADKGELKVADFNLSIQVDPENVNFSLLETMCGTPNYVAPEILSQKPYDFKCDIWSLGVICYLLLSGGYLPFFVDVEGEAGKDLLLKKVRKGKWSFYPEEAWQGVSDQAKDFLRKVMEKSPEKRLDYEQLLAHPWLAKQETDEGFGSQAINVNLSKLALYRSKLACAAEVKRAAEKFWSLAKKTNNDTTALPLKTLLFEESNNVFGNMV